MAGIEIKGVDALIRKLGKAAAIETLEPPMRRAVLRLLRPMQAYPPPPPDSKYIRGYGFPGRMTSEKLGQRWTTKVTPYANGLVGKVGNNASYAPWVQSKRFQATVHRGRWTTDADAVSQNEAAIVADFQNAIDRALSS